MSLSRKNMHDFECKALSVLLEEPEVADWRTSRVGSLDVNYESPHVERLWFDVDDEHRIFLHRIAPCLPEEALLHPHPWPSMVKIIEGSYVMGVGHSPGPYNPPISSTLELPQGSVYEMTDRNGWHFVAPTKSVLSIMVTGKPWADKHPGLKGPPVGSRLRPLSDSVRLELIYEFKSVLMISTREHENKLERARRLNR